MFGLASLGNAVSLVDLQRGVEHGFVDLLFVRSQLLIEFSEPADDALHLALDTVEGVLGQRMSAIEQALPGRPRSMSLPEAE